MGIKHLVPLSRKVNLIIVFTLVAGIGGISFYFTRAISSTIETSTENNLRQQSDILYTSIENFMLPGQAPLVVGFFEDMREINPDYSINLYRREGVEAFTDNSTIITVNSILGQQRFEPRFEIMPSEMMPVKEHFSTAVGTPPREAFFTTEQDGKIYFRVYKPLINLPKCTECHGSDHTVRGVIDIQSDITASIMKQRSSLITTSSLFLGVVVLVAIILALFMKRMVITPVKVVGNVCTNVTRGNFDARVSIHRNDEIGLLGETVNTMVEGLRERFELSKYVSSSTLKALKGDSEGKKVMITLFFSDIRGFTSYSEQKEPESVVHHLNELLNMQTTIIRECGGDVDKYVGDEVVAIFADETPAYCACHAALRIIEAVNRNSGDYDNLRVGIGINTGEVILGMIGSEKRADYTVIGDNVNTASRLCDAAEPGQILISDGCYRDIQEWAEVEGPYKLRVKGKSEFIKVYILTGLSERPEDVEDPV